MINSFSGEYRFLSNFWPAKVKLDRLTYPSVEHAYQAAKTLDLKAREPIRLAISPSYAKKIGRLLVLRPDWDKLKLDIMKDLVRQKFNDPNLRDMLVDTRDHELVEGNYWNDTFWGVCNGVGKNHLGKILMKVRDEIIEDYGL